MKTLFISLLILLSIIFLIFGLSLFVLKHLKGSKMYYFVKRHLITDEDLEK
jgi:hypothetical protein